MKKLITIVMAVCVVLAHLAPVAAATDYPEFIYLPERSAVVDGVIDAGEWDDATPIILKLTDIIADQGSGVPGAMIVGGYPDPVNDDDVWLSVRMMVSEGFLYILEERMDSTLVFTHNDPQFSYATDGSIIFFCDANGNVNAHDIFLIAETNTQEGPMVAHRGYDIFRDMKVEEAKSTVTENSFVLEAKISLEEVGMTEQDLKDGKYLVTYCAINIIDLDFSGSASDLWGDNYQIQYKGVNAWNQSPAVRVIGYEPVIPTPTPTPEPTATPVPTEPTEQAPEDTADPAPEDEAPAATAAPTPAPTPVPASSDDDGGSNTIIIVIIVIAVVVVGGACVFVFMGKGKKKK